MRLKIAPRPGSSIEFEGRNRAHRHAGSIPQWKRPLDIIIAMAALVLAAPLIIAVALLVGLNGGAPFYLQPRLGLGGRRFVLYKIRTMCRNSSAIVDERLQRDSRAAEEFAKTGRLERDARISPIGRFLRRHGIDELPQLINVIKGDMSLVGPRPRTLRWLSLAEAETAQFRSYFTVRPGITGLWQVSDQDKLNDQARMRLDAEYVARVSLRIDVSIILRTIPIMLLGR
jgi:lipopolysaccharide/colanic/teichoic acid biosynthesis glycosyltransferase